MFHVSGQRSRLAKDVQGILDRTKLNKNPDRDDSFALVLFLIDPVDQYRYILAHAGLAEPEPMFTPRLFAPQFTGKPSARGFRQRERIPSGGEWAWSYDLGAGRISPAAGSAMLWVSRRKHARKRAWLSIKDDVLEALAAAFASDETGSRGPDVPLYPSLWNTERIVLDNLRARVRALGPLPAIREIADEIRSSVAESFHMRLGDRSQVRVGVYMFTGSSWVIPGGAENPYIPSVVRATGREQSKVFDYLVRDHVSGDEHAFDWVYKSGKPVLLRAPLSRTWQRRLNGCGVRLPNNGGICIAPIQYDRDDALASGLLFVSVENPNPQLLAPAFCFLASRVAQSIPGYLAKLSGAPGFPWWPDVKIASVNSEVLFSRKDGGPKTSVARDDFERKIERVARSLMPDRSRAQLTELAPGLTSSVVYKLDIADGRRLIEIPRVLKIGDARVIGDELHRYFRYVHNKPVGGHSRLDVAMGFPEMPWIPKGANGEQGRESAASSTSTAAIAYTFVGIDAKAVPWSTWARSASPEQVQEGIRMAMAHLSCWHRRERQAPVTLGEMLATASVLRKQEARSKGRAFLKPTMAYMEKIREFASQGQKSPSCIVHGDLHCDNLFALLGKDGELKGKLLDIAIIDWGKVDSGRHPATDLAILLGDLAFRVRAIKPETALAYLVNHARTTGLDETDATIVYCFHLLRMLAWGPLEGKDQWIPRESADAALKEVERILVNCGLRRPRNRGQLVAVGR